MYKGYKVITMQPLIGTTKFFPTDTIFHLHMRTRIFGVTDGTAYSDCYHYPTISYYFLSSPLKETTDCGVWYFCDGGSSGSRGEGVGGVRGGDHLPRLSGTLPRLQDPPLPPLLLQGVRPTTGPLSRDQPPLCVPRVP